MTDKEYQLMDAILSEGLTNAEVIMVRDTSTKDYFGTKKDIFLNGKFVAVYHKKDEVYCWLDKITPDFILEDVNEEDDIYLYSINN